MEDAVKDIDIITAAISGDRIAVLRDQLDRINTEIIQRLAINITTREAIHDLLHNMRQTILHLEPAHEGLADDPRTRTERLLLEREYRSLILRLADEQRSCWEDIQALKAEARIAEKELLTMQRRDRRLSEFT